MLPRTCVGSCACYLERRGVYNDARRFAASPAIVNRASNIALPYRQFTTEMSMCVPLEIMPAEK
jgi:hypothetical protein